MDDQAFHILVIAVALAGLTAMTLLLRRLDEARRRRAASRLALALLLGTAGLILLGAMVVSTRSGMAFMDWPTSDGLLWPSLDAWVHDNDKFYEHSHRLYAEIIGLLAIQVVLACSLLPDRRHLRLALIVLLCIVIQGSFGGLTVFNQTHWLTTTLHGTFAQFVFGLMALLYARLSGAAGSLAGPDRQEPAGPAQSQLQLRSMSRWALGLVICQTIFGALYRNMAKVCELISIDGRNRIVYHERMSDHISLLTLHAGFAVIVISHLILFSIALLRSKELAGRANTLALLLFGAVSLQFVLGVIAVFTSMQRQRDIFDQGMNIMTSMHAANGALILALVCYALASLHRQTRTGS